MRALKQVVKNKKGISSLFIAIYIALLAVIILSTLFIGLSISHSSIASYSKIEQERTQENILIKGPGALNVSVSDGTIRSLLVNNTGGITVRIRSLYIGGTFVCDPSTFPGDSYIPPQSSLCMNLTALDIDLNNTILEANWTVTTERGTKSSETGANLWLGSTDTQDEANKFYFGPLLIIFNMFHWSNDGGDTWNSGWTIPKAPGDIIWRIMAADIDERSIILNASSSFALIQNSKQSNKIETWNIGPSNLNPSQLEPGVYYFLHFSLNGPNSLVDISTPNPVTLNFMTIIGSFIEQDGSLNGFAQTIPFEAVKISVTPEIPTYTALSPISSPQAVRQPVAVSGTVTVDTGAATVPQNSIVMIQYSAVGYEDWENILTPIIKTGSGGSFTGSFSPLHAGTYEYRAMFMGATKGSDVWAYSNSTSQIIIVNKASSTTTMQSLPAITIGQSISATATVNPSFATGTVTFEVSTDGGATYSFFCTKPVVSGSAVSDLYTPAAPGNNYRFRATYNGDADVLNSPASTPVTLTVNKATPTLTTPTLNPASPIDIGQSVTATVTITGVTGVNPPTGTITFRYSTNGGTTWNILSTATLASGSATSTPYTPSVGGNQYRIRADYSGDTNYNAVNSAVAPLTVRDYPSITSPTLTPPSPISFGTLVTIRVTVSGTYGTPTGNVDFRVSTDNWATFTKVGATKQLIGGVATSDPYLAPSVGNNYQFRAVYAGDNNYLGIESPPSTTLTVNQATSTTTLILSPPSAAVGQPVTATATVTPLAATGTVAFEFSENGIDYAPLGIPVPLVSGSASSIPYTPLAPGTSYSFRATYNGDTNVLGSASLPVPLTVYGPLDHFVFQNIDTQTVGAAFSITITAKDSKEITVLNYNGANSLSFSAGTISPTTAGNFVNGVRTISVTVTTSGSNVFISTTGGGATGQSNSFTVNPGPLARFQFNTISSPQTAGTPFSVTITAQDAYGNTVTSYTGTNALTASTGTITPTTTTSFSNGAWTGTVAVTRAGSGITIGTTGGTPTRSGTSNAFDVAAGSVDRFILSTINNQIEGIPFSITITAQDAFGNTATSYTGTNTLADLSNTISLTSTGAFTSGTWTGSVSIAVRYPADAITTTGDGKTGTSNTFIVTGPLDHFNFNTVGNGVAGTPLSITITAVDSSDSTITSYTGINTLSTSTGTIIPISTSAFTNGIWTGTVTLTRAGTGITISTTGGTPTISGTSNQFNIAPAALAYFTMTGYPSFVVTAGQTFNGITVAAYDAYDNIKTNYVGQVYFTSTDLQATLPFTSLSKYTITSTDQGIHIFDGFALKTAGLMTLTVRDDAASRLLTGNPITVNAASIDHLVIGPIVSPKTMNTAFSITITGKDLYGNTATGYSGTATLTSSTGGGSISPASVSLSNGQWTGSVTINGVAIAATISATSGGFTATSNQFSIYGTNAFSATISPTSFHSGTSQQYTITITNLASGTTTLGSARIAIPSGFSVASATITPPAGRSWNTPTIATGQISISARNGNSNPIRPGESITITFTPTQTPTAAASYIWTTTTYSDNNYGGTQLNTPNPQPQTTIQYLVTFTQSGLSSDASGTVVTVSGAAKTFGDLPFSVWVDASTGSMPYTYSGSVLSSVAGKQYVKTSTDASPVTGLTGPATITGLFQTQYYLTVTSSYGTPSGQGWHNAGSNVYAYLNAGTIPTGLGAQYAFTSWGTDASGTNYAQSNAILMNGPKTASANWHTEYLATFTQLGLSSDATGTFVTIDSAPKTFVDLPSNKWVDASTGSVSFSYDAVIASNDIGKRYVLSGVDATSPLNGLSGPVTVSASYGTQYYLTVQTNPSGIDTPSPSTWYNIGDTASISVSPNVDIVTGQSRYYFIGWSGTGIADSSASSTTITIDASAKTVIANYATQYFVNFAQSSVDSDFTGAVMNVDGYDYDRTGRSGWYDSGTSVAFSFTSPLVVTPNGKQYVLTSVSASSPLSISAAQTITGSYNAQYYLTLNNAGHGTTDGSGWYDVGTSASFSVGPTVVTEGSTQYVFTAWSGDSTSTIATTSIIMSGPKAATANWKTQYAITASAGPNGLIDPLGTVFVDAGSSQTFTITTDTGYHIGTLTVDGSAVPVDSSYSFTNVYASHTISATFAIDTNTIVASAGANGAINPSGNIITNYGGSQSFTITPSLHYHVADVLVDSSSVGAVTSYTFTDVIAPHTITASFAIDTYTITVTAGTNGAVSPGTQTVDYGATPSFSITPATGYHVLDVKVDGASFGPIPSYTFNAITADHTLEATFEIDTYSITASAGASGSISPSGNVPVDYGDSPTFTMTPNIGYHIFDVLVDGVSVGNMNSYTFASVSASHAIAVTFAIDTFTISVNSGTYGSIAPGTTTVNYGSSQTFDVAPKIGYHIFDVEVDGVSQGAIAAYTFSSVQANHAISATFEINTYTITATASAGGTISPSGSVTVNHGSDQTFAITPDIGYNIVDVTVDGTLVGAITSFTFTSVTADHTISATFST